MDNKFCPSCEKPIEIIKDVKLSSFCVCPPLKDEAIPEEKCYTEINVTWDYISYLTVLSNKKHHLDFPCDIKRELDPKYMEFIEGDYYHE